MSELSVKVEDLSQVKKKMSFEIPWAFVKDELDAVYRTIGKKAKIKGFRPGKIPRKVLETYFKSDAEGEAITNIVNRYYWQELYQRKMVSLSRPEIEQNGLKEDTDFSFSASFETEPEIDPQGYQGIELTRTEIKVSDADMEKRLNEIRRMFASLQDVAEVQQLLPEAGVHGLQVAELQLGVRADQVGRELHRHLRLVVTDVRGAQHLEPRLQHGDRLDLGDRGGLGGVGEEGLDVLHQLGDLGGAVVHRFIPFSWRRRASVSMARMVVRMS